MGICFFSAAGTSASTPQISGMFVLMNQERMNSGLPPLGFPLPLFYKLASARPDSFYGMGEYDVHAS